MLKKSCLMAATVFVPVFFVFPAVFITIRLTTDALHPMTSLSVIMSLYALVCWFWIRRTLFPAALALCDSESNVAAGDGGDHTV